MSGGTDSDRIKRLEQAVERLCDIIGRIEQNAIGFGMIRPHATEMELIKQLVRGQLEPRQ